MRGCCESCALRPDPAENGCNHTSALRQDVRRTVALAGNPNCGKTTLFNALTGLRQKIANYPGVTVEKKTGFCRLPEGAWLRVIDLPGTYSLVSRSPDERVATEVLRGHRNDTPAPDVVVAVVDASNLQRNLYLVSQLMELGRPLVVALNMIDVAEARGLRIDCAALAESLGVPVVPLVAHRRQGLRELMRELEAARVPPVRRLASVAATGHGASGGTDPLREEVETHYRWVEEVAADCVRRIGDGLPQGESLTSMLSAQEVRLHTSERIDAVLLHRFWGLLIFALIMGGMFASMFTLARPLQDLLSELIGGAGSALAAILPGEAVKSLVRDGIFAGVGSVVVFVPQIAILFLFLALLEDSGYLARAAFLMDRLLARVGLHGKSFIPLLSGFACAIPAVMATRTIEQRKGRLATILVIPFMTCSARLPVYGLLVGTFFAGTGALGQAGIMLSLYLLGIVFAAGAAFLFRRTLLKGRDGGNLLELPTYKLPQPAAVARQVWLNSSRFLVRAGTTILAVALCFWVISYFPRLPEAHQLRAARLMPAAEVVPTSVSDVNPPTAAQQAYSDANALAAEQRSYSLAGRMGRAIEPLIRPLGYDWKMGVGIIGAFAAREVFVSTLAIVYGTGEAGGEGRNLARAMRADLRPDGRRVWTPLVAGSLLLWFVLAMQCLSTVMVVRQETGGWRWPLFMLGYMNLLAYGACLAFYQIGIRLFGA